jgi:hypothetical protein
MPEFRKLVTIRTVSNLSPIEGADLIEVATVDGWNVVVKKGEFKINDQCVYAEIDSFLQDGVPAWQFLVDKQSKMLNGVKGHKLRTMKLRGVISQGFILPIKAVPVVDYVVNGHVAGSEDEIFSTLSDDQKRAADEIIDELCAGEELRFISLDDLLGVVKYDPPLSAQLAGQAEGLFPSFIKKTDQERCQNLAGSIFGYKETLVPFEVQSIPAEALEEGVAAGRMRKVNDEYFFVKAPLASPDTFYEVSIKLDGSSMTAFGRLDFNSETKLFVYTDGICSRNLQLKVNEENSGNSFVKTYQDSGLQAAIKEYVAITGNDIAVQGELMGPGIQGNREQLSAPMFYVFDVYDIARGVYVSPAERTFIFNELIRLGANIKHVPVLHKSAKLADLNLHTVQDILNFAEGPSIKHPVREGLVFKRMDGWFSFKAISNAFLAKEKD